MLRVSIAPGVPQRFDCASYRFAQIWFPCWYTTTAFPLASTATEGSLCVEVAGPPTPTAPCQDRTTVPPPLPAVPLPPAPVPPVPVEPPVDPPIPPLPLPAVPPVPLPPEPLRPPAAVPPVPRPPTPPLPLPAVPPLPWP